MEGKKTYRGRAGRVLMDDAGLDVRSRRHGGLRLPWAAIAEIRIDTSGRADGRRVLTVRLADRRTLTLPAPIGGRGDAALFDAQAREIIDAYRDRGAGWRAAAPGDPQDAIPPEYRRRKARRIEAYAGPSRLSAFRRPGAVVLFVLLAASLFGLGGSIHSYLRDLPAYDVYRAASPCSAVLSANGGSAPYCIVTDGVVVQPMSAPYPDVYELDVGPTAQAADTAEGLQPVQYAFFRTGQPALGVLQSGDPIDYVAADGGNVASVTLHGVTYQTLDSPQVNDVADWASVFASASLVLLFGCLLGLRVARRSLAGPWIALPFALVAALITNAAVGDSSSGPPPASALSLLGQTAVTVLLIAGPVTVVWCLTFRRRGRRPVSRPRRVLP